MKSPFPIQHSTRNIETSNGPTVQLPIFNFKIQQGTLSTEFSREYPTVQLFNCQFSISRSNKEHSTRNFQGNIQRSNRSIANFQFQDPTRNTQHGTLKGTSNGPTVQLPIFNFKIQQGTLSTKLSREHPTVQLFNCNFQFQDPTRNTQHGTLK